MVKQYKQWTLLSTRDLRSILANKPISYPIHSMIGNDFFKLEIVFADSKIIDNNDATANEIKFLNGASLSVHTQIVNYTITYCFAKTWQWTYNINERELLFL